MSSTTQETKRIDTDSLPKNFLAFIAFLKDASNSIPERYRDKATIEVEAFEVYGEIEQTVSISYYRDKTSQELALDAENEELRLKQIERRERAQLANLLKKYPEELTK